MTYLLLALKYWRECFIALLAFLILCLLMILNHKDEVIEKQKQEHITYVQTQTELNLKAQVAAREKEKEYQNQIILAERNYSEKIKQISHDARIAESHANSLSKQLATANKRLPTVTREAETQYAQKLSNVFDQCVTEYRKMAERADGHEADARRLVY
ncbi:hypothetical protein P256_00082 [Acinetobacter nectaris CIP 110549]|uniref:DUF2514 domain-containing protein n=1 Tax=Acinetobacter nectaris CIP 110549 TaxID=1392540 RepID=V2TU75_9GAMM|nr:hypothetical protein [Acinetobacter nectaris]ESK41097.1 hypothetical protein P256_00082 [Acinetobacter nectaris CIP 110549]